MGNKPAKEKPPMKQRPLHGHIPKYDQSEKEILFRNFTKPSLNLSGDAISKPETTFDSETRRTHVRIEGTPKDQTPFDSPKFTTQDRKVGKSNKTHDYKTAINLIADRQKDHAANLRLAKDQMLNRDKAKVPIKAYQTDFTDKTDDKPGYLNNDRSIKEINFATFYDANLFGFKLFQEGAYRQFRYTLQDVRRDSLKESLTAHYSEANIVSETVFNYKSDGSLREEGFPIATVFLLPEKMKVNQKKIRLLALKNELLKFMRADPIIKEIDLIAMAVKRSFASESEISVKRETDFFYQFKIEVLNEIGSNSVVVTRIGIKSGEQLNDHSTLVCPDVTSFQMKRVESLDLKFRDVSTVTLNSDSVAFDFFRLRCADDTVYMIKTLHMNTLSQSWNPLFYMLQEFRIYGNHLYHQQHYTNILAFKDYFLTAQSSEKFSSVCFIYEDFDCTLRDIMNDRMAAKLQFTVAELMKIFGDVFKGLCVLHKLGIVHRNLKPENIVYSAKKSTFMIANLSLALVFNKEETICSSYDLVGTPFYMAVDMFADLMVENNGRLRFVHDPFKADVYSVGVMMLECLWINMKIHKNDIMEIKRVFNLRELKTLDNLLELCEIKHREHNLFVSIIRKKPSALEKLPDYEKIKEVLENLIFEDATARYDAYQAKNAIARVNAADINPQAFNVEQIRKRSTLDFSVQDNITKDSLFLCLKNSQFLKDLNLGEQANIIDCTIERLWNGTLIEEYKGEYTQFVISRIKNLAKLKQTEKTLEIIEEQLVLYEVNSSDEEYTRLALECLLIKNDIMFLRCRIQEFFDANEKCDWLVKQKDDTMTTNEIMTLGWKLAYSKITVNFWLFNESNEHHGCIHSLENLMNQIKGRINVVQIDHQLLIGCLQMMCHLTPDKLISRLRLFKDLEDKMTASSRDNYSCLLQLYLFQTYYLALEGSNIPAFEYSKKVHKIISGNFEERSVYEIVAQIAPLLAGFNTDSDEYSFKVKQLVKQFTALGLEDEHISLLSFVSFFLQKLVERFCSSTELKMLLNHQISLIDKSDQIGYLAKVRPSITLIEIYVRDLQFDQAFTVFDSLQDCIQTVSQHCTDLERLFWVLQIKPRILFEQGRFYEASQLLETISAKVISEQMHGNHYLFSLSRIRTDVSFLLMRCYIKMRRFEAALPVANILLKQYETSVDDLAFRTKVIMAGVRVLLSVHPHLVRDIPTVEYINRITEDAKNTVDVKSRIDILYFLAYFVYLRMKKFKKATMALDDGMINKLLSKEHTRKNQIAFRLLMKRKQLKLYLKIWEYSRRDQKVVERILRLIGSIVKKLSVSPSPYEKHAILKTFSCVAQAYLSLGMLDECLINLSKAMVSLSSFNVSGTFLIKSKIDLIFAKVNFLKGRDNLAFNLGQEILNDFGEFFGKNSQRTKKVYNFLSRVCDKRDQIENRREAHPYDDDNDYTPHSDDREIDEVLAQKQNYQSHKGSEKLKLPHEMTLQLKDLEISDNPGDGYVMVSHTNASPLSKIGSPKKPNRFHIMHEEGPNRHSGDSVSATSRSSQSGSKRFDD